VRAGRPRSQGRAYAAHTGRRQGDALTILTNRRIDRIVAASRMLRHNARRNRDAAIALAFGRRECEVPPGQPEHLGWHFFRKRTNLLEPDDVRLRALQPRRTVRVQRDGYNPVVPRGTVDSLPEQPSQPNSRIPIRSCYTLDVPFNTALIGSTHSGSARLRNSTPIMDSRVREDVGEHFSCLIPGVSTISR